MSYPAHTSSIGDNWYCVPGIRPRNVICLLGASNVRRLKAEDLVGDSLVRKLEKKGRFYHR